MLAILLRKIFKREKKYISLFLELELAFTSAHSTLTKWSVTLACGNKLTKILEDGISAFAGLLKRKERYYTVQSKK